MVKKTLFIWSLFLVTMGEGSKLYFKYPDALGPDDSLINVESSDYRVLTAESSLPEDVILNYSMEEILERYKLSDNFVGFVFDDTKKVKKVVRSRTGSKGVGDIKTLTTMGTGWEYHELRPLVTNNTIYVSKFFGYIEADPRGVAPEDHCLVRISPTMTNPEDYCSEIPRCFGVLQWANRSNICLVGNSATGVDASPSTVFRFVQKKVRHDIFVTIGDNAVIFSVFAGALILVQVLVPFGLNTSVINGVIKRVAGFGRRRSSSKRKPAPVEQTKSSAKYEF